MNARNGLLCLRKFRKKLTLEMIHLVSFCNDAHTKILNGTANLWNEILFNKWKLFFEEGCESEVEWSEEDLGRDGVGTLIVSCWCNKCARHCTPGVLKIVPQVMRTCLVLLNGLHNKTTNLQKQSPLHFYYCKPTPLLKSGTTTTTTSTTTTTWN